MPNFRKSLLISLGIGCTIIIVIALVLSFVGANIKKSAEAIERSRQELIDRTTAIENLARLQSQYSESTKKYLQVFKNVIPEKDQLINLSRELQSVAVRSGINFGFSFTGETPPAAPDLGSVNFSIKLIGTFEEINKFIEEMKKFRYLTVLEGLSVNNEGLKYEVGMRGRTFYR